MKYMFGELIKDREMIKVYIFVELIYELKKIKSYFDLIKMYI